jgi:hypothetical protein
LPEYESFSILGNKKRYAHSHPYVRKYRTGFLFLLVACFTAGCYDCGPQAEPTITLSIARESLPDLREIGAMGTKSDTVLRKIVLADFFNTVDLPVSMLQDSTTFLLFSDDTTDTLTLFYQRIFDIKKQCGYYIDLTKPTSGPHFRSTLPNVAVEYNSYLGPITYNRPWPRGIVITIQNP